MNRVYSPTACGFRGTVRLLSRVAGQYNQRSSAMGVARFNSDRSRKVTLTLAILAVLHFLLSSLIWAMFVHAGIRQKWELRPVLLDALPAFLLLLWFATTLLVALRRLRVSAWLLVFGFVASGAFFTYDAVTRNYQLHTENYHGTGHQKTFHYATWWWYDESWIRG